MGERYQLPQSAAHNETRAAVGSALWNWRMLTLTGEARFADLGAHAAERRPGRDQPRRNPVLLREYPPPARYHAGRVPAGHAPESHFISCFMLPPERCRGPLPKPVATPTDDLPARSGSTLYGGNVLDTEPATARKTEAQANDRLPLGRSSPPGR